LALLLVVLLLNLVSEGPPPACLKTQVNRILAGERFDFVGWEVEALLDKLAHHLIAPQRYVDEAARHDFFLDYLGLVADIQWAEWEIHRTYTDPEVQDPEAATAELRAHVAALRAEEKARQMLAEAILEEQIACTLADEGFGVLGQEFPPIGAHFTPLPLLLVVSPRDHIESILSPYLRHGLDTARREAIEEQVDTTSFDVASPERSPERSRRRLGKVSSLVTGIGGLSAYPAMLLESSSLNWIAEVAAHEWTHHPPNPHHQRDRGFHRGEGGRTTDGGPLLPRTVAAGARARAGGTGGNAAA
jgi:hypothetical protein